MDIKITKEELTITQKKEVKDAYKIITNKYPDGLLRVNDLKIAMMGLGLNPSNDEIDRIITQLKLSKKLKKEDTLETMTFDEFYDNVHFRVINKKYNFDKESEKMFELITDEKNKYITEKNIQDLADHFEVKDKKEEIEKIAMMGLGLNPSNDEIDRIITQLKLSKKLKKEDKLETMTFDEFYDTVHFRIINKKLNFEKESEKMFGLITEQKNDFITEKNIKSLADHFEVKEKNEDIKKIVKVADVDKDGKITYKDFVEILKHSNYT